MVVGNAWKNWVSSGSNRRWPDGFGEATLGVSTLPVIGALDELRPFVVGEDPLRIDALWGPMLRARTARPTASIAPR